MLELIIKPLASIKRYIFNEVTTSIGMWLIGVAFVFFTISALLYVIFSKGIDASFVSAVMDSIIAGTAILAVFGAKNYLAQFTAQEGFKIAISLANDDLMTLDRHHVVLNNYLKLYDHVHEVDGKTISKSMAPKLTELQKELTSSRTELHTLYNRILEKKRKLDTYGIAVQNSKNKFYIDMISNLTMFLGECQTLESKTQVMTGAIEYLYKENENTIFSNKLDISRYNFNDEVPDHRKDINLLWMSIINNYTKFREEGGSSITKLFKVNG